MVQTVLKVEIIVVNKRGPTASWHLLWSEAELRGPDRKVKSTENSGPGLQGLQRLQRKILEEAEHSFTVGFLPHCKTD